MIGWHEASRSFKIDTPHSSYVIALADEPAYAGHAYFGKRISDEDVSQLLRIAEPPYVPSRNARDKLSFLDTFPMEYPTHGVGDFRGSALKIRTKEGHSASELFYLRHEIVSGKPEAEGLPATFGDNASTLKLILWDEVCSLEVELRYSVFEDCDAVLRSARITNRGTRELFLEKALSASFDMDNEEFELLTLHGSWARERHMQRRRIGSGFQGVSSGRGETSHQHQPFLGLLSRDCTQERGEAYGLHLIYSGNFLGSVYGGQFDNLRISIGIDPEDFCWRLAPGESFLTPEAVLVYSDHGLGGMSRSFHDLYRRHLIRSVWKDRTRPVLINNWEATYFDFDEKKLLAIAEQAAKCGIEMLVMDDGWFGNRFDDNRALGDWKVNEEKIRGGLKKLTDGIGALGMRFGIWFEPEMVSPDSDLYREHPDWAIAVPGRKAGLCRNQYVLDLTRSEVRDHVFGLLTDILDSADIAYVKWDMNRQLADLGSLGLDPECQGELSHRYVLAVYELQERLIKRYPELLLENCSGGGARFDPGMLYYSPQIWCSDDTDAVERLMIQEGTALLYPLSVIGAHVSDCPNHTVGRVTPFETRGYVALAGTFGYELDITKISEEDRALIPKQVEMYHRYHGLFADGDYYRLASYSENRLYDAFLCASKDQREAVLVYVQVMMRPNHHSRVLKLAGLDPKRRYRLYRFVAETAEEVPFGADRAFYGDTLMNAGITIGGLWGDFKALLLHVKEEE
ncbi:MAG: alpha-galactosidase [Lachnospiraceae bacterium]|nr:alpha-galactosidase [Lachnospiraceae bacterium]